MFIPLWAVALVLTILAWIVPGLLNGRSRHWADPTDMFTGLFSIILTLVIWVLYLAKLAFFP